MATLFTFAPILRADEIGFDLGNNFESKAIEGDVTVQCNGFGGQFESATFACSEELLDPNEYAKFQGHKGADADLVILKATHEDGSVREKNEGFDSSTGLSKDTFNLWISTLFQRPLLDMGKNEILYTLKKSGNLVLMGNFTANVKRTATRYCTRHGFYNSNDINDCRFSNNICDRYFYENNYCQ